ncbi:cation transporter [Candidatus Woesearchaeota archaeon]|nr:cation transporter [Candidatus Woesearchaeota archaeon]
MPNHPAKIGMKSAFIGIIANFLLAIIKGITGFLGNSYALIADAIESFSDIFSSLIVLAGLKIAAKPADEDHPYGHGKAEPMAAVIVALGLIGAAAFIAVKSANEIALPHHAPAAYTLIVLVAVIAVKEMLFRFVFKVAEEIESTAVKTDAWHHRSDALTSAAAFIGISIALIGGKGYKSADDYAALFASAIIAFNGCRLLKPAVGELMDRAPNPGIETRIRKIAKSVNGVAGLDKCHVRKMGLNYYVDLHVIVDGKISVRKGHEISHKVKAALCRSNLKVCDVLVHIEPD